MKMLDGLASAVVKKFFFSFDNVHMRAKSNDEKGKELLSQLAGKEFDFLYEKFSQKAAIKQAAATYSAI